jgi:hypothetical protein
MISSSNRMIILVDLIDIKGSSKLAQKRGWLCLGTSYVKPLSHRQVFLK